MKFWRWNEKPVTLEAPQPESNKEEPKEEEKKTTVHRDPFVKVDF
jgi:hypothetical protein